MNKSNTSCRLLIYDNCKICRLTNSLEDEANLGLSVIHFLP